MDDKSNNNQNFLLSSISNLIKEKIKNVKKKIILNEIKPFIPNFQYDNKNELNLSDNFFKKKLTNTLIKQSLFHKKRKINNLRIKIRESPSLKLINPNKLILKAKLLSLKNEEPEKKGEKILKINKYSHSVSQITKNTNDIFHIKRKEFSFLKYENPFIFCPKLNLNKNKSFMEKCTSLPLIRNNSQEIIPLKKKPISIKHHFLIKSKLYQHIKEKISENSFTNSMTTQSRKFIKSFSQFSD